MFRRENLGVKGNPCRWAFLYRHEAEEVENPLIVSDNLGPVAQSGQSSGLIIRWLQVQILPGPP